MPFIFFWETAYSVVFVNINFSMAISKQKPYCSLVTKTKVKLTTYIGMICQYSHSNSVILSNKVTRNDLSLRNIDEYNHKTNHNYDIMLLNLGWT